MSVRISYDDEVSVVIRFVSFLQHVIHITTHRIAQAKAFVTPSTENDTKELD